MNDEEKLGMTKEAFIRKIDAIPTWDNFKTLVDNITKQQIINFVKNTLEQDALNYRNSAINYTDKADDIDDLVKEVDGI